MQNINGRLGITQTTYKTLSENGAKNSKFLDPISTFNTRRDFRVDPLKSKQVKINKALSQDPANRKKKNLTFS
jgi:hypothetical protein